MLRGLEDWAVDAGRGKLLVVKDQPEDQRFSSFSEWSEAANRGAARREDDTPVLAGQTGPRRRATKAELMELVEQQQARYAASRK